MFEGVQSAGQVSWLPCQFIDEEVTINSEGHIETKHIPRKSTLQFGLKGDPPVNPNTVTFLITPSKLDLRRYLDDSDVTKLSCELRRYSTDGTHVRWPVRGEHEYNHWFILTIAHTQHTFTLVSFIRESTNLPPTGQHEYRNWTVIEDTDVLTTSVVMVMKTNTLIVKVPLKSKSTLHCQFNIDHKSAKTTVEWHKLGETVTLFSHDSQSGGSEGSGVALTKLATGDASYTIPETRVRSEGDYICSVNVHPLLASVRISVQVEEAPEVSLNVPSTLTLDDGALKRVVCEVSRFYPLDADIQWSHQGAAEVGPRVDTAQLSSHTHHPDKTYSLSAFFYLQPKLRDSGRKFTCTVSHKTLKSPIKKTFTLIVREPGQWILIFNVFTLLVVLVIMLRYICRVKGCRLC